VARLLIAVVKVPVAVDWLSVEAFSTAAMNEPRAAFPPAEVSLASSAVSVATYALRAAAALVVDSLCSGANVLITLPLIELMILQSAADTPVAEAAGEEAAVLAAADVVAADADAGALDELDELLLHPAMRAPPTARTASTVRDERWNISATSRGAERTKRCIS
jgi:alkylation response protein AidB-like acyl-CoA dehydrogenase